MFQLLFDTRLFKFTADAPQCNPLLELPPTIARESSKQGTARTPNPLIKMDTLYTSGLCEGESPLNLLPAAMRQAVRKKGRPRRSKRYPTRDRSKPPPMRRKAIQWRSSHPRSHNLPERRCTILHRKCMLFRIRYTQPAIARFLSFWWCLHIHSMCRSSLRRYRYNHRPWCCMSAPSLF